MGITLRDRRLLYHAAGGMCAFPTCDRTLCSPDAAANGSAVNVGEEAHIVAREADGPRGDHPLPEGERDRYDNLILLCTEHHKVIDDATQVPTYTVDRLRQMKVDHEEAIERLRRDLGERRQSRSLPDTDVDEPLHGSFFHVERLPAYVFSAECDLEERAVRERILTGEEGELAPYMVRGGRLYAFNNLRRANHPFRDVIQGDVEREESEAWWDDDDRFRWYQTLLNRTLNKLTGRRRLRLDKDHHRYFFEHEEPGKTLRAWYTPMNVGKRRQRKVVWRPITKKTNQPKRYWYHLAVALRFERVGTKSWCLTLRPEMRVTRDGREPIASSTIGAKVTRRVARNFNDVELRDVQFWRSYLFEDEKRWIGRFGPGQAVVIDAELARLDVRWPGVPADSRKSFANARAEEDLFTLQLLDQLDDENAEELLGDWSDWSDDGEGEDADV